MKTKFPLAKGIRSEIPKMSGSPMMSQYVFGHNPREQQYSHMEGTHIRKPKKGGLSHTSAPLKTELDHFDSKHGFPGSFGRTGLTGES